MSKASILNTSIFTFAALMMLTACGSDDRSGSHESLDNVTVSDSKKSLVTEDLKEALRASQEQVNRQGVGEDVDISKDVATGSEIVVGNSSLVGDENTDARIKFYDETVDVIDAAASDDSLAGHQQFCSAMSALLLVSESAHVSEGEIEASFVSGTTSKHSEKFQSVCVDGANEDLDNQNEKILISSLDEILVLNEDIKTAAADDVEAIRASAMKSATMYCQSIALLDTFRLSESEWAVSRKNAIESALLTNEFNIKRYCPFTVEISVEKVFELETEELEDAEKYFQDPVQEEPEEIVPGQG